MARLFEPPSDHHSDPHVRSSMRSIAEARRVLAETAHLVRRRPRPAAANEDGPEPPPPRRP